MKYLFLVAFCTLMISPVAIAEEKEKGWKVIFAGKSFEGWKANENEDTWKIEDGAFVCHGPRSHLFYMGADKPFKNFEFKAEVRTKPGSNAGIYFHTKYQETGWPKYGFETQVNNTHGDPKKTGSLYAVVDVLKAPANDNEWWTQHIIVKGNRVIVKIDGKTVVDYKQPENQKPASKNFVRLLGEGTFALQGHDPKSIVHFRNIRVKRLP